MKRRIMKTMAAALFKEDGNHTPIFAVFHYMRDEPYGIVMTVGSQTWTFGRQLLAEGSLLPAGEMDVVIEPVKDGIQITLQPPGVPSARLVFNHDDMIGFLHDTLDVVAYGDESKYLDIDRKLSQWLAA